MPPIGAPDRDPGAETDSGQSARAAGEDGVTLAERRANVRFMLASLAGCGTGQLERKENKPGGPVESLELRVMSWDQGRGRTPVQSRELRVVN